MLPSKTLSKSFAQCQRHRTPPANGCERLTTVAVPQTTSREQGSTPRPPELNENPSLRIRKRTDNWSLENLAEMKAHCPARAALGLC